MVSTYDASFLPPPAPELASPQVFYVYMLLQMRSAGILINALYTDSEKVPA
jgi:hypothetical protein